MVGVEALIRWQHPTRGLLAPVEFMDVAEQSGLIVQIGEWVLRTACAQAQAWNKALERPLKMAINLSPSQLNDKNLVARVKATLEESGLPAECLELELTESTALQNIEYTIEILQALQQMGVSIAVDDFGKGYSSMDYIKNLPSNILKIDRSFITDISKSGSESEVAIVLAMVTMAHQLHLKVTAEGVETEEQLLLLTKMNCDQIQGYYMSKPITVQEFELLLKMDKKDHQLVNNMHTFPLTTFPQG